MSTATVSAFENTLHKTNVWLKDLRIEMHWESSDHQHAYHALRAVLQALRDRLPTNESADFASQLPMLIRGFYYEGWSPATTPISVNKREEFLQIVAQQFSNDVSVDVEEITRAVFRVINKHVSAGEIDDVKQTLPESIRSLWE